MTSAKACLAISLLCCSPLFAQQSSSQSQLRDALTLEQQGAFPLAGNLARRIIDAHELSGVELGRAWLILGSSLREEGKFAEAQTAFEASLRMFEKDSGHPGDYASALANYAQLFADYGQPEIAVGLLRHALLLRQQISDHAAAARSLISLAKLALAQKHIHEAQLDMKTASEEMKVSSDLVDDDFLAFFEAQGMLAMAEKQPSAAVDRYAHALQLCIRLHGEQHWLTGWEYSLLAIAYAQSGDTADALADFGSSLAILDHALGDDSVQYHAAEAAYSQVLERAGRHAEAVRLASAAKDAKHGKDKVEQKDERKDEHKETTSNLYGSSGIGCTIVPVQAVRYLP